MKLKKFTPPYVLKVCEIDRSSYSLPLEYAYDIDAYLFLPTVARLKLSTALCTSVIIDLEHNAIIKCDNLNSVLNEYLTGSTLFKNFVYFNVPYDTVDDFFFNFSLYLSNSGKFLASQCDMAALYAFCQASRPL